MCEFTAALLPRDKPRYLMGVGTPLDILEAVHRGVDMFDCIIPTQVAQRGGVFTSRGFLQLRRGVYKFAEEKLDPACDCPTCRRFPRAYLHHLTKTSETLGWQLLGKHNIHFYHRMMREIRQSIIEDRFGALYREKRELLHADDLDNPVVGPRRKPQKSRSLGGYEIHIAHEGHASIRHVASGEIMHSRVAPMDEARALYTGQSNLDERLRDRNAEPLVIWDVGLGGAANAMAAIQCFEAAAKAGSVRPLRIISFENDLDSLRLACRHQQQFPYLWHSGPAAILQRGEWQSREYAGLSWYLVDGDFLRTMRTVTAPPDLIFYDMFSSKTCADQWTLAAFRELFAACGGRAAELFTYSVSTAARVALLAAGFYVARGRSTGPKEATTIACTPLAANLERNASQDWLGAGWLGKWHRSQAKFPTDLPVGAREEFEQSILSHPQFIMLPK